MAWSRDNKSYGSQWRKIRKQALDRDTWLCVQCYSKGLLTKATEVDHIVEKANGGTDHLSNLQSLCHDCHQEKTSGKRAHKGGCGVDGWPTHDEHYWNN